MLNVRLFANWCSSEDVTKRMIEQFKTSDEDISNINIVYDDSFDLAVFFNYISYPIRRDAKILVFPHEPTWSGSHQKDFRGYDNIIVFGFDKKYYLPEDCCLELPSHTFYGGRGSWVDKEIDWSYNNLVNKNFDKTKSISSIVTTYNNETYDGGCSYKIRYDTIKFLIEKTNFIDFYGGWDISENCKTEPEKMTAVKDYRFCLAIENQFTKNWITEKFYDSILTNTIPIYCGCQNIKDLYPENGYFLINDINNKEEILELLNYINNNSEILYNTMLPELLKIKDRYYSKYNPLKLINNVCEKWNLKTI